MYVHASTTVLRHLVILDDDRRAGQHALAQGVGYCNPLKFLMGKQLENRAAQHRTTNQLCRLSGPQVLHAGNHRRRCTGQALSQPWYGLPSGLSAIGPRLLPECRRSVTASSTVCVAHLLAGSADGKQIETPVTDFNGETVRATITTDQEVSFGGESSVRGRKV